MHYNPFIRKMEKLMKIKHALVISMLAFGSTSQLMADESHEHDAKTPSVANPCAGMMKNKPTGMGKMMPNHKCGMMKPDQMKEMMAMKKAHMQKMEQHMAKMEAMMQELIDLQKANNK